jgi:hypothetical protein
VFTACIEQNLRALDVGVDKRSCVVEAAVHVALGREVNHGMKPLGEEGTDRVLIIDGSFDKVELSLDRREILQVAGVAERVEDGDVPIALGFHEEMDKVRTDKAGTAGYEEFFHVVIRMLSPGTRFHSRE